MAFFALRWGVRLHDFRLRGEGLIARFRTESTHGHPWSYVIEVFLPIIFLAISHFALNFQCGIQDNSKKLIPELQLCMDTPWYRHTQRVKVHHLCSICTKEPEKQSFIFTRQNTCVTKNLFQVATVLLVHFKGYLREISFSFYG